MQSHMASRAARRTSDSGPLQQAKSALCMYSVIIYWQTGICPIPSASALMLNCLLVLLWIVTEVLEKREDGF